MGQVRERRGGEWTSFVDAGTRQGGKGAGQAGWQADMAAGLLVCSRGSPQLSSRRHSAAHLVDCDHDCAVAEADVLDRAHHNGSCARIQATGRLVLRAEQGGRSSEHCPEAQAAQQLAKPSRQKLGHPCTHPP